MNKQKLSEGWKEVELGEVFDFQKKSKIKAGEGSKKGKYKFFTSSDKQTKFIDEYNQDGEFLIFATGGHAGIHYCNEKFATSTDCFIVNVDDKILTKYIYYYLFSKIQLLEEGFKGAGLKHISKGYIQDIKLFYPENKETQKAIVSILEKAEKSREWRKKADDLTKDYLKSVFLEMFYNGKYEEVELKEVCDTASGGTPSRGKKEYWENGTIPWIKSGDLNKNQIVEVDEFITEVGLKNSSAKYIKPDTVLIAMYGATAGKSSISRIKATTNQAVCAIVPKKDNLNRTYLLYWLRSIYVKIVALAFGGGQPNISQQVARSLKIPLPPIEFQNKFAKIVEEVEAMKEQQKHSKNKIDNLFNALMQKAFKGELII